ncbi:MAG: ATP-binding protein [Candidatus Omnitrophota bacterium]|nr:ATP-binding protein [Candidatus Omnitrophota bacterium]
MKLNLYFLSHLSSCLIVFLFSLFAFKKNKKSRVNRSFFVFGSTIAVWLLFSSIAIISDKETIIVFWYKLSYIGIILIPYTFSYFVSCLVGKRNRFLLFFSWLSASSLIIFLWSSNWLLNGIYKYNWGYYPRASLPLHPLLILIFVTLFTYAIISLFLKIWDRKNAISDIEKLRTKYALLGTLFGVCGSVDFLANYGINIYPFGFIFMMIFPCIYTYAIVKYQLMDIRVAFSRATALIIAYPFLLSIPFFFAYTMQPVLYPLLGMHWWFLPFCLLAFFATLSTFAYNQIKKNMENILLAEQKSYQKLLLQAASGMVRERNLNHLAKLIVYIIKKLVKIEFAAIFLDNPNHQSYHLKAIRDSGLSKFEIKFPYNHPLVDYLRINQTPVPYEELPESLRNSLEPPLPLSLIIPSSVENNLLGFVFLGEKLNHQPYSQDDLTVFRTLSHQAALAISYCLFLEEFKNAQEKIFTADKLHLIGGMADGAAHQIKNRLNQFAICAGDLDFSMKDFIKTHPKLIDENPDLKKAFDEFLTNTASIIANVTRTDGVIKGILNFGRAAQDEKAKFFSEFSLNEFINNVLELVQTKHEISKFPIRLDLGTNDIIYGIRIQLLECLFNIIDNAYEAILDKRNYRLRPEEKDKFKPSITLKLTQEPDYSLIAISDNGSGVKEKDKSKIFAPFFTTKSSYISGTGIGMYVVKRLIEENHQGKVWFESEYMKGTTLYIKLPKKGVKP